MDLLNLYDNHYQKVRKFILTITKDEWAADDLIQETFIRVKENMTNIREPEKVSSWMFKIAYHLCMDHLNGQTKERPGHRDAQKIPIEIPVFKKIEQQEMGACVQEKINRLPESMRIIIDLFDRMEFSHREIAEILSITEENSKVKLHRARQELKSILKKECTLAYDERNVFVCEPVHLPKRRI